MFASKIIFNRCSDGLVHCHLPDGPTAHYKLSNVRFRREIRVSVILCILSIVYKFKLIDLSFFIFLIVEAFEMEVYVSQVSGFVPIFVSKKKKKNVVKSIKWPLYEYSDNAYCCNTSQRCINIYICDSSNVFCRTVPTPHRTCPR